MLQSEFLCWLALANTRVENHLTMILNRLSMPPALAGAMQHCVLGGGKRLRPAMLLAVADVSFDNINNVDANNSTTSASALDAACALECVHCYSLAHDDLPCMDDADFRRDKPSCHKAHGEAMALLAGDCLQTLAFEILADCNLPGAVKMLSQAAGGEGMGGGQALDLQAEASDEAALQQMHKMKTGALFHAAVQIGLICRYHEPPADKVKQLHDFADAFGKLFQIMNDIKDVAADSDLNKKTYATLLGVEQATHAAEEQSRQAHSALNNEDYPLLAAMTDFVFSSR